MRPVTITLLSVASLALALSVSAQQTPAQTTKPPAKATPPAQETPLPTLSMVVPQRDRDAVYAYYRAEVAAGRCPMPMVKMSNACVAPSPGKQVVWKLDVPLADGIKGEAPPAALIAKLSPSPAGYQYLRVDNDLLIVGLGTRLVAALVADLSRI